MAKGKAIANAMVNAFSLPTVVVPAFTA